MHVSVLGSGLLMCFGVSAVEHSVSATLGLKKFLIQRSITRTSQYHNFILRILVKDLSVVLMIIYLSLLFSLFVSSILPKFIALDLPLNK